mmetsp:Transcript_27978/g.38683  ORF Transcript_27978/g.38683 Transcript_27978/m.38683 type:complete len:224 (+) Transcript_27978:1270-1941(+)
MLLVKNTLIWYLIEWSELQMYMQQLMESLHFLHDDVGVMHRNIKRANILFTEEGELTLIDFEDCVSCVTPGTLYPRVGNNRYRAPEMRAQESCFAYNPFHKHMSPVLRYNSKADMFSAGLVFAELIMEIHRFFDVIEYMDEDYDVLRERLRIHSEDPLRVFSPWIRSYKELPSVTVEACDLLSKMLCFDENERISAADALNHPYFKMALECQKKNSRKRSREE